MNKLRILAVTMLLSGLVVALPVYAAPNNPSIPDTISNPFCDGNLDNLIGNLKTTFGAGVGQWFSAYAPNANANYGLYDGFNCWSYSGSLDADQQDFAFDVNPVQAPFVPATVPQCIQYQYCMTQTFSHPANQVVDIGATGLTILGQTQHAQWMVCYAYVDQGLPNNCESGTISGGEDIFITLPISGVDTLSINGINLAIQYVHLGTNDLTPTAIPSNTPSATPTPPVNPNSYCYLITDCTWQQSRGSVNSPNTCFGTCTGSQWDGEESNINGNCSGGPFSGLLFWGTNCVMITSVVIPVGSTSWTFVWSDYNHTSAAGTVKLVDVTAGNTVVFGPAAPTCNGSLGVDTVPPTANCSAIVGNLTVGDTISVQFQDTAGGNLGAYWDLIGNAAPTNTPTNTDTPTPTNTPLPSATNTPVSYDGTPAHTATPTIFAQTATSAPTPTGTQPTSTPCIVETAQPNGWVNFVPCGGSAPTPCAGSNSSCSAPTNSCQNTNFSWKPPDNLAPNGIASLPILGGIIQATLWIVVGGWNLIGDLFIPQHISCDFNGMLYPIQTKVGVPDLQTMIAPLATGSPCGYLGVQNIGVPIPNLTKGPTPYATTGLSIGVDGCADPWVTYFPIGRGYINFAMWAWFLASSLFFIKSFFTSKSFDGG